MAKYVGLTYNFDKTVIANMFNRHRFSRFAKQYGKQDETAQILFSSYYTDGKNAEDYPTLIQLGEDCIESNFADTKSGN